MRTIPTHQQETKNQKLYEFYRAEQAHGVQGLVLGFGVCPVPGHGIVFEGFHVIAQGGGQLDLQGVFSLPEQAGNVINMTADLNMSYSLFRKVFKEITCRSPGQYLLQQRIEKARELLSTTMLPVKEIALLTGFQSVHYFSRVFKIKSGYSPLDYRKRFFYLR